MTLKTQNKPSCIEELPDVDPVTHYVRLSVSVVVQAAGPLHGETAPPPGERRGGGVSGWPLDVRGVLQRRHELLPGQSQTLSVCVAADVAQSRDPGRVNKCCVIDASIGRCPASWEDTSPSCVPSIWAETVTHLDYSLSLERTQQALQLKGFVYFENVFWSNDLVFSMFLFCFVFFVTFCWI